MVRLAPGINGLMFVSNHADYLGGGDERTPFSYRYFDVLLDVTAR